jgi:N-acetylmuramoyl-L-alanine amidase
MTSLTPIWVGSPNFNGGRRRPISAVVIHVTEGSEASVDSWFKNPASKVSAHYMVTRDGRLKQYVKEEDTAWHAGKVVRPTWSELFVGVNPNQYTIGIEHEAESGSTPWTKAMYERSSILLAEIFVRWGVPLDRYHIVGHREIRADKTCPGAKADIGKLIAMARDCAAWP